MRLKYLRTRRKYFKRVDASHELMEVPYSYYVSDLKIERV